MYKFDRNLILARSNSLSVMRLTESDIELVQEIPVQDQVVSILKVPTGPVFERESKIVAQAPKSGRLSKNSVKAAAEIAQGQQQSQGLN